MHEAESKKKTVLVLAGHDPSGAAGIQADIESIGSNGCQCISVITALTTQNTARFIEIHAQPVDLFRQQCEHLLQDIKVDACKIGLIGDLRLGEYIDSLLHELAPLPVVLDPVLHAGSGTDFVDTELCRFIAQKLAVRALICTPNVAEAKRLTGLDDIIAAGESLVSSGCQNVLITGGDEDTAEVTNLLFQSDGSQVTYAWERLPGIYHGSGCTLSGAIAANLARGNDLHDAVKSAQEFTWQALKHGARYGCQQRHPDRYWNQ